MKILLISIIVILFGVSNKNDKEVYICVSKTAAKYHLTGDCKGLSECTHTIKKVSLKKANELGYKNLCGYEK
ncbi:hypothetical protein [Flavobacterium pectinovorum]|uniref:hypothetical protein n=1 Tax=Flavobacterium pectinovorum TaxID=29533 RepID=UPI001FACB9B7|nr:hypothetical protein [Flavobacterium pectinovorum]MCI9844563.1 hypothetical protein [Flavobacterium pectinovorum]